MRTAKLAILLGLGSLVWTGCGDDSSPTGPSTNPATVDTAKKVDTTTIKVDTAKHRDSTAIAKPDSTKNDTTVVVKPDTTKPRTPISAELIGTWQADTAMTVNLIGVGVNSTVILRPDGTFLSTMGASVLGNPISGDLFKGEGTWVGRGTDTLIATSTACTAADTSTATTGYLAGKSLPFKQVGQSFAANEHKPTACPAPMVLSQRPVAGKIQIVQSMNVPTQGKQNLPLTFLKKP